MIRFNGDVEPMAGCRKEGGSEVTGEMFSVWSFLLGQRSVRRVSPPTRCDRYLNYSVGGVRRCRRLIYFS